MSLAHSPDSLVHWRVALNALNAIDTSSQTWTGDVTVTLTRLIKGLTDEDKTLLLQLELGPPHAMALQENDTRLAGLGLGASVTNLCGTNYRLDQWVRVHGPHNVPGLDLGKLGWNPDYDDADSETTCVSFCIQIKGTFQQKFDLTSFPLDIQGLEVALQLWRGEPDDENGHAGVLFASVCAEGTAEQRLDNSTNAYLRSPDPDLRSDLAAYMSGKLIECAMWRVVPDHCPADEEFELEDHIESTIGRTDPASSTTGTSYSKLIARFNVRRRYTHYVGSVVLPCFVLTTAAFFSVFIDPFSVGERLNVVTTLLLSFIAFRQYVSSFLPKISYTTLLESYANLSLVFLSVSIGLVGAVSFAQGRVTDGTVPDQAPIERWAPIDPDSITWLAWLGAWACGNAWLMWRAWQALSRRTAPVLASSFGGHGITNSSRGPSTGKASGPKTLISGPAAARAAIPSRSSSGAHVGPSPLAPRDAGGKVPPLLGAGHGSSGPSLFGALRAKSKSAGNVLSSANAGFAGSNRGLQFVAGPAGVASGAAAGSLGPSGLHLSPLLAVQNRQRLLGTRSVETGLAHGAIGNDLGVDESGIPIEAGSYLSRDSSGDAVGVAGMAGGQHGLASPGPGPRQPGLVASKSTGPGGPHKGIGAQRAMAPSMSRPWAGVRHTNLPAHLLAGGSGGTAAGADGHGSPLVASPSLSRSKSEGRLPSAGSDSPVASPMAVAGAGVVAGLVKGHFRSNSGLGSTIGGSNSGAKGKGSKLQEPPLMPNPTAAVGAGVVAGLVKGHFRSALSSGSLGSPSGQHSGVIGGGTGPATARQLPKLSTLPAIDERPQDKSQGSSGQAQQTDRQPVPVVIPHGPDGDAGPPVSAVQPYPPQPPSVPATGGLARAPILSARTPITSLSSQLSHVAEESEGAETDT